MVLSNITNTQLQQLIILDYEYQVKTVLLVGWFIFSLFYILYLYKNQEPTKLFLVGTARAVIYVMSYMYSWLFWLIYPVFIHPNVPIDNLLLFLAYSYTGIFTTFFVIFMFNFTLWIPKIIITFGKIDVKGFEDHAIKKYFGNGGVLKWLKKRNG